MFYAVRISSDRARKWENVTGQLPAQAEYVGMFRGGESYVINQWNTYSIHTYVFQVPAEHAMSEAELHAIIGPLPGIWEPATDSPVQDTFLYNARKDYYAHGGEQKEFYYLTQPE